MKELINESLIKAFNILKEIGCTHFYQERGSTILFGAKAVDLYEYRGFRIGCNGKLVNLVVEQYSSDGSLIEEYKVGENQILEYLKPRSGLCQIAKKVYELETQYQLFAEAENQVYNDFVLSLN